MNRALTSKEIFLRILESLNQGGKYTSNEVMDVAKEQYKKLRNMNIFNKYLKIKGDEDKH